MKKKIERRDFLKQGGILTAGLVVKIAPLSNYFLRPPLKGDPIPIDKNIDPAWLKSLYQRGNVTTYLKSKNELQYIGMPAGGINCGTVYLGGDGRLWLWDIFNKNQEGIEPKIVDMHVKYPDLWKKERKVRSRDGSAYVEPAKDIRPLEQGFAVKLEYIGNTVVKQLKEEDWDEIMFEATYPMATIRYVSKEMPITIEAKIYSPFIPLDEDNSGLPAVIYSFNITNNSTLPVSVSILGWLENKAAIYSGKKEQEERVYSYKKSKGVNACFGHTQNINNNIKQPSNDDGNLCIACLHDNAVVNTTFAWPLTNKSFGINNTNESRKNIDEQLIASSCSEYTLQPGKAKQTNFVIGWYFPNLNLSNRFNKLVGDGRYYATKFTSSFDVIKYIADNFKKLSTNAELWKRTWYDESTLPHWFLERTFLNISTLATTTCQRFTSGRFWAWEGVGACEGTCTHVWQYAQAVGRIFPALERNTREQVDLKIAMQENGGIKFRGELETRPAVDGQAGTVLRIYREHQMSADGNFLKNNWAGTKRAIEYLFTLDKNNDGMEDTPVENTLDAMWDGEIAWIVGLCIAAVKAGEAMAIEMNDTVFADKCKSYVDKGRKNMEAELFNGEYFIHKPDAIKGRSTLGSYNTCHIDQVFGQSWAFQVGLGRVLDKEKTMSALKALWKYNFATDVGPYLEQVGRGRPYALPGEAGLIMNTNPLKDPKPYSDNAAWQLGYFHECMSGFEHQVASHMMAEGMTDEALVITRAIHDRYHAAKRNPFNEIECSDHYARAMASYGTFITACGFEYHGPKAYIRFAPKWNPKNFKAPFTTATGWGTYSQVKQEDGQMHNILLRYGTLRLSEITVENIGLKPVENIIVKIHNQTIAAKFEQTGSIISIKLNKPSIIKTNETLIISIT